MKTTVVPAQITTVEDRIAGNLTFTQIIMLIVPLITSTIVYILIPPRSGFTTFKIVLIVLQFMVFGTLAIRVRGKILIEWLAIYLKYKLRPRIYIFTKNDQAGREAVIIEEKEKKVVEKLPVIEKLKSVDNSTHFNPDARRLLDNSTLSFRFGISKKGGIDVSITPSED
ncbi:MAG: PrgI family protein [Patescibacteria group bacterium]